MVHGALRLPSSKDRLVLEHTFTTMCVGPDGQKSVPWERVRISPYDGHGGDTSAALLTQPYLWLRRRYIAPVFAAALDSPLDAPACQSSRDALRASRTLAKALVALKASKEHQGGATPHKHRIGAHSL